MAPPAVSVTVCSICGEPLQGRPDCLACLVRGGLDETGEAAGSRDSLVFGDFEIERRDDGSFWELGHGAMGVTYRATDRVLRRSVALKVIDLPAGAGGAQAAPPRPCAIPMWRAFFSLALRLNSITAITRWSWSKAKPWRHSLGGRAR